MIQRVSVANRNISFAQDADKKTIFNSENKAKFKTYADSFTKHASDSVPILLAVSGGWTAYDVLIKKAKFKKAFKNNFVGFFAPVLFVSSTILSILENKKTSKSSN